MNQTDCIYLLSRTDFASYVNLLRTHTSGNFSLTSNCKNEVCGALWGLGNPDISGIGLGIGYLLESAICAYVLLTHMYLRMKKDSRTKRGTPDISRLLLASAATVFYDNATFFCFAIQTASIITLSRVDFGISAEGMGGFTLEIAWLASSLTLLPLLLLALEPKIFLAENLSGETHDQSFSCAVALERNHQAGSISEGDGRCRALTLARRSQRFLPIVVCWAMGFGPFFSRMGGTFGQSRIGDTPGTVISTAEWNAIESVCFKGVNILSIAESNLITAFGIVSYVLMSIVIVSKIIASIIDDSDGSRSSRMQKLVNGFQENRKLRFRARILISIVVSATLVIQFWAFFRLRKIQGTMVEATGGSFNDQQWGFGQIVAVLVFVPVAVEVMFVWRKSSLYPAYET